MDFDPPNLYQRLNLSPHCSVQELKAAWTARQALGGDGLDEALEAWLVLSDPIRRAEYDAYLHGFEEEKAADGPKAPFQVDLSLSLAEAVFGCTKEAQGRTVEVPPATQDGDRLTLGSMVVWIQVDQSGPIQRRGFDLCARVDVPVPTAALGGKVQAPNLDGQDLWVQIPAECKDRHEIRLPSLGVPRQRGRGDLILSVHLTVPKHLTRRQKKILKEFDHAA